MAVMENSKTEIQHRVLGPAGGVNRGTAETSKTSITLLFLFILVILTVPLLMMLGQQGLSTIELVIASSFLLLLFSWLLKSIRNTRMQRLYPVEAAVVAMIVYFVFDLILKVVVYDISFKQWLHWRKFMLVLVCLPIGTELKKDQQIDAVIILTIAVGVLISVFKLYNEPLMFNHPYGYVVHSEYNSQYPLWSLLLLTGLFPEIVVRKRYSRVSVILLFLGLVITFLVNINFARRTPLMLLFAVIAGAFFINRNRLKYLFIVFIIATVTGLFLEETGSSEAYLERFRSEQIDHAKEGRLVRYSQALSDFYDRPLFGNPEVDFEYYDPRLRDWVQGSLHSLYFYILYHGGLFGALIFLLVLATAFKHFNSVRSFPGQSTPRRGYVNAIFLTYMAMLLCGFTSTRMIAIESWLFLGICIGLVSAIRRQAEKRTEYTLFRVNGKSPG